MPKGRGKTQALDPKGITEARKILPFNHLRSENEIFFRIIPQMSITPRVPSFTSASVSPRRFLEACSPWQGPFSSHLVSPSQVTLNPNQWSSHITRCPQRGKWPGQSCVPCPLCVALHPLCDWGAGVVWFTPYYSYTAQQINGWIKRFLLVKHFCCGQLPYMLQRCLFNSLAWNQ